MKHCFGRANKCSQPILRSVKEPLIQRSGKTRGRCGDNGSAQVWAAPAADKEHASPEARSGAQRGAPPTPHMEAARRRFSADSEPLCAPDNTRPSEAS